MLLLKFPHDIDNYRNTILNIVLSILIVSKRMSAWQRLENTVPDCHGADCY